MKILAQSIEIPPTPMDPLGECTHLIRLAFRHADEEMSGARRDPIYLVYSCKHNTVSPITKDGAGGAGEYAIYAAFKNAETSRPDTDKPPEIRFTSPGSGYVGPHDPAHL